MAISKILDASGHPIKTASPVTTKARAMSGRGRAFDQFLPYDSAKYETQHMEGWHPVLTSPDQENFLRDTIVARQRDQIRNDGFASGAITRICDNTIGAFFRPIPAPDYQVLSRATGIKAFDHEWARDFTRALDANWRTWSEGTYCDTARINNFSQQMFLAFRHFLIDGDALARVRWMPKRVGKGKAHYATAFELIDADRLSNPQLRFDNKYMRGGVEVDADSAPVAYYMREAHQGDWYNVAKSLTWERVPKETSWGRLNVVHVFSPDRAAQHRGIGGIFLPVLERMRMLFRYDRAELDAAIINSVFANFITSPNDHESTADALDSGEDGIGAYEELRAEFHHENDIKIGEAKIPILFPGEEIKSVLANRPSSNFAAFESAVLNNISMGLGLSAAQLSNDFSKVNYSSARSAILEAWKTMSRRKNDFAVRFANPIRQCFIEESFDRDSLPLPKGAPDFIDYREAYSRADWPGVARGWVDPVAETQGAQMQLEAGFNTLKAVCAEQNLDFEEVLEQRKYEIEKFKEYGIPLPDWTGANLQKEADAKVTTADASQTSADASQTTADKPVPEPAKDDGGKPGGD